MGKDERIALQHTADGGSTTFGSGTAPSAPPTAAVDTTGHLDTTATETATETVTGEAGTTDAPREVPGGRQPGGPVRSALASRGTRVLVAVGLVLVALNLRPAVSGLGPLLEEVRTGLGLSGAVLGVLTSVPALCFAVFGSLAPRLARRFGPLVVVVAAMGALAAGLALRALAGGTAVFLLTTALALAGIAVGNVLMPVVVKRWFPDRVGTMTGLYSTALAVGTSGAAALTVPLTQAVGGSWRFGLGVWALLALVAMLPFGAVLLLRRRREAAATGGAAVAPPGAPAPAFRMSRSATAWALGVFFGLQATGAYVVIGWLAQIYRDSGLSASTAGALMAVAMGVSIPLSFVLPRVAAALSHQGPLAAVLALCGLGGYTGLILAPTSAPVLWALLLGVSNCAFPLVLTMIGMRSRTGVGVAKLSAFVQSTGYLIAIPGPLLVGVLHDASGSWNPPLLMMCGLLVVQLAVGVLAGRHRFVEDGG
ncbi:MFS transporter [Streptomyces sp. XM4193]|uniref:CynX/NimT family MFS transporter n=1 Tax=Streptomyces sp. XM4193 TaxID=2929782 RepID=UPI001FF80C8D|nr:MFS transporter [Streptomyces sp. XM4193]MCK1796547.1 MFS transporter [Streptomyces sp. XM4193]